MRYIQSPPNHRGPRVLLAVALSVGVHVAAVGLAGVLSAATPPAMEVVETPTNDGPAPGVFESPVGEVPGLEPPLPDVTVVEISPPTPEVAVAEEPPPSAAPSDFFDPPRPPRRGGLPPRRSPLARERRRLRPPV